VEVQLKVVVVSDYAHPGGGAEKVAIESAIGLARAGDDVHFLAAVGPIDPELAASGVTVHLVGIADLKHKRLTDLLLSGLWSQKCAAVTEQLLADLPGGETVVHVHGWQRGLTASTLRACRASAHPMLVTLHEFGMACPNQGFFDYQRGEICTRRALGAECLTTHCDTRSYAHKLWRAGRIALQRTAAAVPGELDDVIYLSGLSRSVLQPYFSAKTRWHAVRNPISILRGPRIAAEQNRTFLFVGRVTPEKGVQLFAAAAQTAGVSASVAGDGPALAALKVTHPGVTYLGWQKREGIAEVMRSARALVFPSLWYEVQPLVVQEAMACGIPVLVADGTAARELVSDGETGLHFRHMSVAALSDRMREMDSDDAMVARMSQAAYERYWQDPPTIEKHVENLRNLYRECLTRRYGSARAS
jgi:glycosyltransferase involved in cell wall biosynthesis